jgi:hypothetical protein
MPDGRRTGQTMDKIRAGEGIGDMAEVALGVKALTVEGGDAAGFLPSVLQGVQTQGYHRRRVGDAENAEDPTLQAKTVIVGIALGPNDRIRSRERVHRDFSTSASSDLRCRWL